LETVFESELVNHN